MVENSVALLVWKMAVLMAVVLADNLVGQSAVLWVDRWAALMVDYWVEQMVGRMADCLVEMMAELKVDH